MCGYDTYFLTGTDEHGDKILKAATAQNCSPKEYTDRISSMFKDAWARMGIDYDDFIRTTDDRHKKVVQSGLQKMYDNDDIYFGSYGGHYCIGCERFLTEKDLVDGKCPEHNRVPDFIEEHNYFFKMKKYQSWLLDHIKAHPDFIRPERYRNEVVSMLEGDELEDLCISRPASRLDWGIPLPFDDKYVTYVWCDALINYLTGIDYPDGDKFKKYWPVSQHLTAKDILKPHGIFWPTMLKAMGVEPYQHLNVHGYWNMEDAKMSKSLGNVVRPDDLLSKYGNDQIRYFFLREMTFGLDAAFSEDAVIRRINSDLANDLGNLINRTINMASKYSGGTVPPRDEREPAGYAELESLFAACYADYVSSVEKFQFHIGLDRLWDFVRALNKYVDDTKPWVLAKENNPQKLSSVLRNLLEGIYAVSCALAPVLITVSPRVCAALGKPVFSGDAQDSTKLNMLTAGHTIGELGILFPRIEKAEASADAAAAGKKAPVQTDGLIDITDFQKVDIRVAEILTAVHVEGSDKLLELTVDSGADTRVIVAGIALSYKPEELPGKKILLVANLKPAQIFKKTSNGMLLAAKKNKNDLPRLIEVSSDIAVGSKLS